MVEFENGAIGTVEATRFAKVAAGEPLVDLMSYCNLLLCRTKRCEVEA